MDSTQFNAKLAFGYMIPDSLRNNGKISNIYNTVTSVLNKHVPYVAEMKTGVQYMVSSADKEIITVSKFGDEITNATVDTLDALYPGSTHTSASLSPRHMMAAHIEKEVSHLSSKHDDPVFLKHYVNMEITDPTITSDTTDVEKKINTIINELTMSLLDINFDAKDKPYDPKATDSMVMVEGLLTLTQKPLDYVAAKRTLYLVHNIGAKQKPVRTISLFTPKK